MFEVHILNSRGISEAMVLQTMFQEFLIRIEDICSNSDAGREMAIVRTKLEEASFFAKRAMAMNPENQKKEGEE